MKDLGYLSIMPRLQARYHRPTFDAPNIDHEWKNDRRNAKLRV